MPHFRVTRVYAAYTDGQHFGPWTPGEVVELDQERADWMNRDSPGVLVPAEEDQDQGQGQDQKEGERVEPPTPNRAQKRSPKTR